MVDQGLPTVQLALAFLIINAQVLVFDLDLVEQTLDLAAVVRVVLLGDGFSKSFDFLFKSLVLHLEISELGAVENCRCLRLIWLGIHAGRQLSPGLLVFCWVGHSATSGTLPRHALRA